MPVKPSFPISSEESVKFQLFIKSREIKQVSQALRNLKMLPVEEREEWLSLHGEFVAEAFDVFIDESNEVLDGMRLDSEALLLSKDLVLSLREALSMVHGILQEPELES